MRDRINAVRQRIAAADPRLAFIGRQYGMFSMLPLSKEQVLKLREDHAIYMAESGPLQRRRHGRRADRPIYRRRDRGDGWLIMADRDPGRVSADVDWREVARLVLTSREMDRIEEEELVPAKKVLYQFSARGHDMAQVLLGLQLKDGDGVFGYYRSRPLLLALGVPLADALGSGMGLAGGYSNGRDIGVVFNYPNPGGAHALADVRRGGRAIYARRRLGAGDRLQAAGAERRAGGCDLGRARRRRELRDRRILVGANYCHYATIAAAHLHRGQWLRHLGPVGISDAGQGHRRQPRELLRA